MEVRAVLCNRTRSLLSAYSDSELTGSEMLRIQDHLRSCPACRRELEQIREIKEYLAEPLPIEAPLGLEDRILQRVHASSSRRPLSLGLRFRLVGTAAAAASFVFAIWVLPYGSQERTAEASLGEEMRFEVARDEAYVAGADPLGGRPMVLPVSYGGGP